MRTTYVSMECDTCGRESDRQSDREGPVTIPDVRDVLADEGWLSNPKRDVDMCPDCQTPRVGSNVPSRLL